MSNFAYNKDIPAANNNPSVDQPNMLTNTNSIADWANVDHYGFGAQGTQPAGQGGYHRAIRQPFGSTPLTIVDVLQIYTRQVSPKLPEIALDTQLFVKTGLGGISQLTGYSEGTTGHQYIGGHLIQWGYVTDGGGTSKQPTVGPFTSGFARGDVVFNDLLGCFTFPGAIWGIFTGLQYSDPTINNGSTPGSTTPQNVGSVAINVNPAQINNGQFFWTFNSISLRYTGFWWVAIGN